MADQAGGDDPGRPSGDAEIGRLQHLIDVDRALHGAAHAVSSNGGATVFIPSQT